MDNIKQQPYPSMLAVAGIYSHHTSPLKVSAKATTATLVYAASLVIANVI